MAFTNAGPSVEFTPNTQTPRSTHQFIQTIAVNVGTRASVGAATTVEQNLVGLGTGILPGDVILSIVKPSLQAGIAVAQARVDSSTADSFYITYVNSSAGAVVPTASELYLVTVARYVTSQSTQFNPSVLATLPSAITLN